MRISSFQEELRQACGKANIPLPEYTIRFLVSLGKLDKYKYEYNIGAEIVKPFSFFEENRQNSQFFDFDGASLPMEKFQESQNFIAIEYNIIDHIALIFFHYPNN